MKFRALRLRNFKGIKQTTIELSDGPAGNIITLIGLNESGKTTILEAISHFGTDDPETRSMVSTLQDQQSPDSFVPKAKKGIFSGRISIEANVALEDEDRAAVAAAIRSAHDFSVDPKSLPNSVEIERRLTYEGGDLKEDRGYWTLSFSGTQGKGKKVQLITSQNNRVLWQQAVNVLKSRVPRISYFPTFLFTFPERIYLEQPQDWAEDSQTAIVNRYYNRVLQDVADSIFDPDDPKQRISIQSQVIDRLKSVKEPTGNPFAFWSYFSSRSEHDKVRAVLNLLANKMGATIFPAWNKIFEKPAVGRVEITFGTDPEKENIPWIQISIFDGQSTYALSERSLGFRWFFSFLLFTQFRANRELRSIFLFDEPAANLHALAQTRLMEGFANIIADGSYIIYSTHSHYLVNPLWLDKAYIVKNAAVDYDSDLDVQAAAERGGTDISATRYRAFVNENPSRISYFQPALDALRFNLGPMVPRRDAIIVEGKFDFHPLEYFRRRYFEEPSFDIFPVNGAGDAAPLVSLFRGWGLNYVILLDDDKGGREGRRHYEKDVGVAPSRLLSISDLDSNLVGKAFESLYSDEIVTLAKAFGHKGNISKRAFFDFFLDRIGKGRFDDNLGVSSESIPALLTGIGKRLEDLRGNY